MKKLFTLAVAQLLILGQYCHAQFQGKIYQPDTSVHIYWGNTPKKFAWTGGFNNPQFAMADLNHDGVKDLVIYERSTGGVKTFINHGVAGNPDYQYAPHYADNFPVVENFLKLEDYNCDNIPDLIQGSVAGFGIYKGYYNSNNELSFTYYKDLWYKDPTGNSVNCYVAVNDIPGVADIDGDGDLDFMSYSVLGNAISLYKNCQMEEHMSCDSIVACFADACWGKSYQGFDRKQNLAYSCSQGGTNSCRLANPDGAQRTTLHQGNTICLIDIDADGDYDYLDGNISFADVQLMVNGRSQFAQPRDSMISQDTTWQMNGFQAHMPNWPSVFWIDYDQDGLKDILISPHAEGSSENYRVVMYYKNTGTASAPVYSYQTDTLIVGETVDVGSLSYPVFYDYDRDGKLDLFLGSAGFYNNGPLRSKVSYYQNTSTTGNPSFTLVTDDFMGLWANNYQGASLAFGDLDEDGKDDMVIGHLDGTVSYFRNTAATAADQPIWVLAQNALKDAAYNTINVGGSASPVIYDMNKDGKPDLLIGYQAGYIYYYQNNGPSGTALGLQKITNKLGNAHTEPFSGFSKPYIGKMDNTGKDYLVMGSFSGALYRYDGFQNGNVTTDYVRVDSQYSYINLPYYSAPAIGDVDGDGKYEMIIGNVLGGLYLYKQNGVVSVNNVSYNGNSINCSVYPNPARDQLNISWNNGFATSGTVEIGLYNMMGQRLVYSTAAGNIQKTELSVANIPSGVYCCIMQCADQKFVTNVTIIK
ncbi:T9SS type A sorting domain-containing protein [Taibaiella soli]|uniref:Secretion system C-terminal sorting domain-containing protein n=1 Tax=Taibaiella soli TaxID=1649169 RepID=A0A2W2AWY6_9BACT|nr:T9SS type A sorting domain-containing protein [Taibaiella soli]PZF72494.1 hypothetical protein DN068_11555 [Taibaiella soli]